MAATSINEKSSIDGQTEKQVGIPIITHVENEEEAEKVIQAEHEFT